MKPRATSSGSAAASRKPGYVEGLLARLQKDVEARKRGRPDRPSLLKGVGLIALFSAIAFEAGARSVGSSAGRLTQAELRASAIGLHDQNDHLRGELELRQAAIERLEKAVLVSTRYGIGADLAIEIDDIALAEGIDPQLAFDLVRVESAFNPRAVSPVGALGLTQLMPATAEALSPGISRQQIFDRKTNLRLGFRFFSTLLARYDGDVRLALLAYNRGPTTVDRLLAAGLDPSNGYASAVMGTASAGD